MSRPSTREPVTLEQRDKFLEALAAGDTVIEAASAAGRGRRDFYRLKPEDAEFAAAWKAAYDEGTDKLEAEAERRAIEGVPRRSYDKDGNLVREEQIYSDGLMMFMLKSRRPEKFRDNLKVEHGGGDKPVQVEVTHSVDDLARVASLLTEAGVVATPGASDAEADEVHPG